jgi:hypothetical protein
MRLGRSLKRSVPWHRIHAAIAEAARADDASAPASQLVMGHVAPNGETRMLLQDGTIAHLARSQSTHAEREQ